ncbi:hypothetical protein BX616_008674, partial [Lobosporangium transversale]
KYPDAKGEAGVSQRLFLVAYILAAKYRCSVELAALLQEYNNHIIAAATAVDQSKDLELALKLSRNGYGDDEINDDFSNNSKHNIPAGVDVNQSDKALSMIERRIDEARSRAQLIFSNYEWARLLSLGSFFNPQSLLNPNQAPPPPPILSSDALNLDSSVDYKKSDPDSVLTALPSPSPSPTPTPTPTPSPLAKPTSMLSTIPSATSVTILQVEDLDRMEAEFLTFLDFDLSTKSQDLETCWNLL